jgi:hypothetical protein
MMQHQARSPKILYLSWGRLEVEGQDRPFKDAKLFPGGAREWDWKETGTGHESGIQLTDVEEVLKHGVTAVVLGRGFYERLQIRPETLQELEDRHITAHVGQTEEAVRLYNELSESERVGALIHSTC